MIRVKIFVSAFLLMSLMSFSQAGELYSKAYGKNTDPAVIFFHGGPGFNSANFEYSCADEISKKGLYVIVFDQRGCGRSKDYKTKGPYTFAEQILDILDVYKKFNIKKASLIGHSWGGTLATKFAEKHPDKVEKIIFIGSPVSYQMTFKGILQRVTDKFTAAHDSVNLKRVAFIQKFDTASLNYSGGCFMFAMANGFYTPKAKSDFAADFKKRMEGTEQEKLFSDFASDPIQGVYDSEKYITLNLYQIWLELKKTIPLYALYGTDDGLFEKKQLALIENAVGTDHYNLIPNASHNVFIDKHVEFMNIISKIFNK